MKKIFTILATAFMAVGMAQCTNNNNQEKIEAGTAWKLISMTVDNNAVAIPQGNDVTINFMDSTNIAGNAGCNYYFGTYKLEGDNVIALNPAGMTKMACPDMAFEDKFIANIYNVRSYTLKDSTLTLLDSLGTEIMVLTPSKEQLFPEN